MRKPTGQSRLWATVSVKQQALGPAYFSTGSTKLCPYFSEPRQVNITLNACDFSCNRPTRLSNSFRPKSGPLAKLSLGLRRQIKYIPYHMAPSLGSCNSFSHGGSTYLGTSNRTLQIMLALHPTYLATAGCRAQTRPSNASRQTASPAFLSWASQACIPSVLEPGRGAGGV